ncbi:unnamed protein product, partial [Prunus brigantina]
FLHNTLLAEYILISFPYSNPCFECVSGEVVLGTMKSLCRCKYAVSSLTDPPSKMLI